MILFNSSYSDSNISRSSHQSSSFSRKLSTFLVGVTFIAISTQGASQTLSLNEQQRQNLGVKYSQPEKTAETVSLHYPAKVTVPNAAQLVVNSSQAGLLISMKVAEGDVVKKGDLLAIVNSPALIEVQKAFLQAKSQLKQVQQDMQRDKQLFEEGIIAERRFLQSKTTYIQQLTDVESATKTLKMSGMSDADIVDLERQRNLNSKLYVYSPATGVIMKQYAIPGQHLNAAGPIYQVADLSQLWLEIHVPISYASTVRLHDPVTVCDRDIDGSVITIGRQVHDVDQGVLVRALVSQHTEQLVPGEFTEVCFVTPTQTELYKLPRSAVFRQNGQAAIFVVQDSQISLVPITIVSDKADVVLVQATLKAGSQVVVEGIASLKAAWLSQESE